MRSPWAFPILGSYSVEHMQVFPADLYMLSWSITGKLCCVVFRILLLTEARKNSYSEISQKKGY